MTTILKASQQLEQTGAPAAQLASAPAERSRAPLVAAVALMLAGLAGGALAVALIVSQREITAPVLPQSGAQAHTAAQPPGAVQPSIAAASAPWGRVEKSGPALPADVARPAPRMRPAAPEAQPRKAPALERADTSAAPAPGEPASREAATGEPGLQVKSIAYTSGAADRTVTLEINGTRTVTLHEGESAGGLEVQLILPAAVYLRRGGNVFAVGSAR